MRYYFIRHGQTDWNVLGKIQGKQDVELNEEGLGQGRALAEKLAGEGYRFEAVYTSKQIRALQTAKFICDKLKLECKVCDGLEEINLGLWEGLSWYEAREKYPEEYANWYNNRRYTKAPQGESYQDLLDRLFVALKRIKAEATGDVAIVTHSAVIMSLQCYLNGTPFEKMNLYKVGNNELVVIDADSINL